jgi:hypothetical protein
LKHKITLSFDQKCSRTGAKYLLKTDNYDRILVESLQNAESLGKRSVTSSNIVNGRNYEDNMKMRIGEEGKMF